MSAATTGARLDALIADAETLSSELATYADHGGTEPQRNAARVVTALAALGSGLYGVDVDALPGTAPAEPAAAITTDERRALRRLLADANPPGTWEALRQRDCDWDSWCINARSHHGDGMATIVDDIGGDNANAVVAVMNQAISLLDALDAVEAERDLLLGEIDRIIDGQGATSGDYRQALGPGGGLEGWDEATFSGQHVIAAAAPVKLAALRGEREDKR